MDCAFYHCGKCAILTETKCPENCKFKKTEEELIAGDLITKKTLEDKGLEKVLIHTSDGPRMSVRRKEE